MPQPLTARWLPPPPARPKMSAAPFATRNFSPQSGIPATRNTSLIENGAVVALTLAFVISTRSTGTRQNQSVINLFGCDERQGDIKSRDVPVVEMASMPSDSFAPSRTPFLEAHCFLSSIAGVSFPE
jgi:hypothetical protein